MHYTNTNKRGFTLVELLIVIVVIAILAAISIVAFNGVQQRGRDASRQSDVSNIVKALTAYSADGYDWPTTADNAVDVLEDYETANLNEEMVDRITSADPGPGSEARDHYKYEPCGDVSAPTGAKISWWKEAEGSLESMSAGLGCV